jgi:hypothetical protein
MPLPAGLFATGMTRWARGEGERRRRGGQRLKVREPLEPTRCLVGRRFYARKPYRVPPGRITAFLR